MDVRPLVIPDAEATELIQPSKSPHDFQHATFLALKFTARGRVSDGLDRIQSRARPLFQRALVALLLISPMRKSRGRIFDRKR